MPLPAGLTAVIVVSLTTLTFVAAAVPKSTAVAPVNPVPMIVTEVPPLGGPAVGLMAETVGGGAAGAVYVNRSADDVGDVPTGLVTVTSTAPGLTPAGLTTTIWVPDSLKKLVTGVVPKSIAVTVARFVPVMRDQSPAGQRTAPRAYTRDRRPVCELIGGRRG